MAQDGWWRPRATTRLTFCSGPEGAALLVDDELIASNDEFAPSWLGRVDEKIVIGGLGWRSTDGGDRIDDPLSGYVEKVQIMTFDGVFADFG